MRRARVPVLFAIILTAAITGCMRDEPTNAIVSSIQEARFADIEKAIKDQKGKVVLVDCWATWCVPCVKTFPQLVERHKKYSEKGLVCIGLCMDKYGKAEALSEDSVRKFLNEKGAAFPNYIVADPKKDERELIRFIGNYLAIPYMALFDRNGRRIWTSDEAPRLTDPQINKKIEELLADQ